MTLISLPSDFLRTPLRYFGTEPIRVSPETLLSDLLEARVAIAQKQEENALLNSKVKMLKLLDDLQLVLMLLTIEGGVFLQVRPSVYVSGKDLISSAPSESSDFPSLDLKHLVNESRKKVHQINTKMIDSFFPLLENLKSKFPLTRLPDSGLIEIDLLPLPGIEFNKNYTALLSLNSSTGNFTLFPSKYMNKFCKDRWRMNVKTSRETISSTHPPSTTPHHPIITPLDVLYDWQITCLDHYIFSKLLVDLNSVQSKKYLTILFPNQWSVNIYNHSNHSLTEISYTSREDHSPPNSSPSVPFLLRQATLTHPIHPPSSLLDILLLHS
jgi:hypothetical protein